MHIKELKCHARRRHPKDLQRPPRTLVFTIRRRGAGPSRDRVVSGPLTPPRPERGERGWRHYHKSHPGSHNSPAWHYLDPVATTGITSRSSYTIRRRLCRDGRTRQRGIVLYSLEFILTSLFPSPPPRLSLAPPPRLSASS